MTENAGHRWPSPVIAWWSVFVFFIVAVISYSDRLVLSLLVDPIRAELHLRDTEVGLIQGLAFALVYSVAGLPFGRLADVFARRGVIIAGVVIWSLCTIACGYASSFTLLFVARIGVGIGEAAFAPAAVSMIADLFPPHRRGLAIGCLLTGQAVGSGLAIVIGGGLLQLAIDGQFAALGQIGQLAPWRMVLVLLGFSGVVPVLLLLTIREPARHRPPGSMTLPTLKAVLGGFRRLAPVLLPLYLAVSFISAGDFSIQNWMPTMLSRRFAYSPGEIASTLGVASLLIGGLGTIAGGLLSDWQTGRGGNVRRLAVAILAVALGGAGAAQWLTQSGGQAIGLFALWIFMSSISGTIGITVLQNIVPNEMRGVGTALVSFCNVLMGLAVGTALTGMLTDHVFGDPRAVGQSMSIVALTASAVALYLLYLARSRLRSAPFSEYR
ncbi:MAG: MFS transporter [Pseudomonadota bacterium]